MCSVHHECIFYSSNPPDAQDLIHDLQRVNRVLLKHANSSYLPEKHLLAKRLSQCLTSSLPSGVHLKALETYRLVFSRIGISRLSRDLPLYAGGLFPLMSYSATSLKPTLLSLYESHFIPLGSALVPVLDGFVLAILSGLEDETSEYFSRSEAMLESLASAVSDDENFGRALWRALLLSTPMRLPAANFIRSRLGADSKLEWPKNLLTDTALVSHAIAAALSDENSLVQRSALDLLLSKFSLDLPFFASDKLCCHGGAIAVMRGVFGTLQRNDMSLTKRVHSWLLGGKEGDAAMKYFDEYTRTLLLDAIDNEIAQTFEEVKLGNLSATQITKPFKIAMGLLVRSELSENVANELSLRALRYARLLDSGSASRYSREMHYSLGELIGQVDSANLLAELERLVLTAIQDLKANSMPAPERFDVFELLTFSLAFLSVQDDMQRLHQLITLLRAVVESLECISDKLDILISAMSFCCKALSALGCAKNLVSRSDKDMEGLEEAAGCFASFFVGWLAVYAKSAPAKIRVDWRDLEDDEEAAVEVAVAEMREDDARKALFVKDCCMFLSLLMKMRVCERSLMETILSASAKCSVCGDPRISVAGLRLYIETASKLRKYGFSELALQQTADILRQVWRLLHPSLATADAQLVQAWLLLQGQFADISSRVVADGILSPVLSRRLRNLERFGHLSRTALEHRILPMPADSALFLMLDALDDGDWASKSLARSWLSDILTLDPRYVLDAPLRLLLVSNLGCKGHQDPFHGVYDVHRALYAFRLLRSIVESSALWTNNDSTINSADGVSRAAASAHKTTANQSGGLRGFQRGIAVLASTQPSARTLSALTHFTGRSRGSSAAVNSDQVYEREVLGRMKDTQICLDAFFPAFDYITVLIATVLAYLSKDVPSGATVHSCSGLEETGFDAGPSSPSSKRDLVNVHSVDDLEWLYAGFGFRSYEHLHKQVLVAAAELLTKLLSSCPRDGMYVNSALRRTGEPVLKLLVRAVLNEDATLQMHFLDIIELILVFETQRLRNGNTNSYYLRQLDGVAEADASGIKRAENDTIGLHLQENSLFVPWVLFGLKQACEDHATTRSLPSHELCGLRRRWVLFIDSIMKHVDRNPPNLIEGILIVLVVELNKLHSCDTVKRGSSVAVERDRGYYRSDEVTVLLQCLSALVGSVVVSSRAVQKPGSAANSGMPGARFQADTHLSGDLALLRDQNDAVPSNHYHSQVSAPINNALTTDDYIGFPPSKDPFWQSQKIANTSKASRSLSSTQEPQSSASSMITAMNPLRMLNDFVKDVFAGSSTESMGIDADPQEKALRLLLLHLSSLVRAVVPFWEAASVFRPLPDDSANNSDYTRSDSLELPRLSEELPRERNHARKTAVLDVLRHLARYAPTDLMTEISVMFANSGKDKVHAEPTSDAPCGNALRMMAVDLLLNLDDMTPEIVLKCGHELFVSAVKWDKNSPSSEDGIQQFGLKLSSVDTMSKLLENEPLDVTKAVSGVGRVTSQPLSKGRNGASGIEFGARFVAASSMESNLDAGTRLYRAADVFAEHDASEIEVGCLGLLVAFLQAHKDLDSNSVWPAMQILVKDVLSLHKQKADIPAVLNLLSAFSSCCTQPSFEKRYLRELQQLTSTVAASCSSLALISSDVLGDSSGSSRDIPRLDLACTALRTNADALPPLMDRCFLDDKTILSSVANSAITPAIATLQLTAAKAAGYGGKLSTVWNGAVESTQSTHDTDFDLYLSVAASDVLLQFTRRDWGSKIVRKEIISLLDDVNFFAGKHGDALAKISAVVSEVISTGGASSVLSSIGSTTPISSTGIPGLFTSRDSETVVRARAIRRVTFCIFESDPDHYLPQLPSILERLRDSLRLAEPVLFVESFRCIRVLMMKTGFGTLSAFRATILSELFRVSTEPTRDLEETLAALQYLDLLTLLSPPDFGYESCFFYSSCVKSQPYRTDNGDQDDTYIPLVSRLAKTAVSQHHDLVSPDIPFRLSPGVTVFSGCLAQPLTSEFVGLYANALEVRNRDAAFANATPHYEVLKDELELEFVQQHKL